MSKTSKTSALIITLIIAMSCLTLLKIKPTNAQTIPKPSVPEFSLRYVENIDNRSIEVVIHDQLPAKYSVGDGIGTVLLYYNIQWKNHSENSWNAYSPNYYYIQENLSDELVLATNAITPQYAISNNSIERVPLPTIVTFLLGRSYNFRYMDNFLAGQKIDFQVKAFFGNYPEAPSHYGGTYMFVGSQSDWSPTQTLTIPESNPSPTATPSPSPSVPEFSWLVIVPLLLALFSVALIIRHRKTANLTKQTFSSDTV